MFSQFALSFDDGIALKRNGKRTHSDGSTASLIFFLTMTRIDGIMNNKTHATCCYKAQ